VIAIFDPYNQEQWNDKGTINADIKKYLRITNNEAAYFVI